MSEKPKRTLTLDELLEQIHRGQPERAANEPLASNLHAEASVLQFLGVTQAQEQHHEPVPSVLTESVLSPRQKKLPMLTLNMIGAIVATLILVAGVSTAGVLTQQSQDVRQQASDGRLVGLESTTQEAGETVTLEALDEELPVEAGWSRRLILGAVLLGLSALVLLGFFVWLFAV